MFDADQHSLGARFSDHVLGRGSGRTRNQQAVLLVERAMTVGSEPPKLTGGCSIVDAVASTLRGSSRQAVWVLKSPSSCAPSVPCGPSASHTPWSTGRTTGYGAARPSVNVGASVNVTAEMRETLLFPDFGHHDGRKKDLAAVPATKKRGGKVVGSKPALGSGMPWLHEQRLWRGSSRATGRAVATEMGVQALL